MTYKILNNFATLGNQKLKRGNYLEFCQTSHTPRTDSLFLKLFQVLTVVECENHNSVFLVSKKAKATKYWFLLQFRQDAEQVECNQAGSPT